MISRWLQIDFAHVLTCKQLNVFILRTHKCKFSSLTIAGAQHMEYSASGLSDPWRCLRRPGNVSSLCLLLHQTRESHQGGFSGGNEHHVLDSHLHCPHQIRLHCAASRRPWRRCVTCQTYLHSARVYKLWFMYIQNNKRHAMSRFRRTLVLKLMSLKVSTSLPRLGHNAL